MLKNLAAIALLAWLPVFAFAEETEKEQDAESNNDSAIVEFEGDANDSEKLHEYAGKAFGDVAGLLQKEQYDEAEAKIDALEEFTQGLELTDDEAKDVQERITSALTFFRNRLKLARIPMADLEKKLNEEPDVEVVGQYVGKLSQDLASLALSEPAKADEQLKAAKDLLAKVAEESEDDELKQAIRQGMGMFSRVERRIQSELKFVELIGQDAAPLEIKDWVNGEDLTNDDLKGKVVLLDFWAVWCGPCVATFPHLRQWHEDYADKGLVIVGLTRYYNMKWDEENGRAARSQDEVTPEDEQVMLTKFAEEHKLAHRFGIQDDSSLSEYYGVGGIPHIVLIDREGKVRMIKVGAGPDTAEAIGAKLEELLAS